MLSDPVSDNELMLEVKAGDLDKLGVLFERYRLPLYRYFRMHLGNDRACEDLVQNVFVRIIRYRERYQPVGKFKSWMFSIAHNIGIDHIRKRSRLVNRGEDEMPEPVDERTAEHDVVQSEKIGMLKEALARIRDDYREVLVLSRYEGMRYREIGEVVGISEGAVKVRIHRALKELTEIYNGMERS